MREVRLFLKVKEWLKKEDLLRTDGIHASDLLDPLYAYWQKQYPQEMSERQVWFFSIGKILHMLVLSSFAGEHEDITSDSGTQEALGIYFSPDAHTGQRNPIELKSHRGLREPLPDRLQEDFGHYLEQLCIYMVLERRLQGELWVLFLNLQDASGRTFPEPRCYSVTITEEQFHDLYQEIEETRDLLKRALESRSPETLELCRSWKCGKNCGFWDRCQPTGRYPSTDKRRWKT